MFWREKSYYFSLTLYLNIKERGKEYELTRTISQISFLFLRAGGQTGYFQQPGNSTLQSGPLQQHQASYGLQGNVFGTHNQSHTSAGLQNLNSHFLSQMQFAMNVQQYRSQNLQNTSYLKSISNQVGDQSGRSQQLKSPGTQQEVLSSVFNSGEYTLWIIFLGLSCFARVVHHLS